MALRNGLAHWLPEASPAGLVDTTVGGLLDEAARHFPENDAVTAPPAPGDDAPLRWTYAELHTRAERLARGLVALGVRPEDRVAIWAPNVPEWLVAEFAVAKAGAVLVTVNPSYRGPEAAYVLRDAEVSCCLFVPSAHKNDIDAELAAVRDTLPSLRQVITLRGRSARQPAALTLEEAGALGDAVGPDALTTRQQNVAPDDIAQVQYTSGTTGRPKGALLSHHSLVNNARLAMHRWGITARDRWCNPMPFFHTTGCGMMALGIVSAGACHCPVERFDAGLVLETVARERCTLLETVPTMLVSLLERQHTAPRALSSLRIVGTSGAPVPPVLRDRIRDEWGARLLVLYGLTEASPTITATAPDDPPGTESGSGPGSVGTPLPYTEVRIVEPSSGATLTPGRPGELQTRGYLTMHGYLGRADATAAALDAEGWLATGDLAAMDEQGRVSIVGRLKDVIIRGGENLYPVEIEDEIRRHPDVVEVCVVGVPDDFFGEQAHAAVQLRPGATLTEDGLRDFLRQRVTHQKVPAHITLVESFPQTASGKIQRFRLREELHREQLTGHEPGTNEGAA